MAHQPGVAVEHSPAQAGTSTARNVQMDLAAVSLTARIPEFWTDQPRHWFIQIESIMNPQHMSDQTKYDLVIGKLSKEAIGQITDLLIQPPAAGKFDALKARLLSVYEESVTRQLQKLLSEMDLGEQKPSQLLRRMRDLAREKVPDQTLHTVAESPTVSDEGGVSCVRQQEPR